MSLPELVLHLEIQPPLSMGPLPAIGAEIYRNGSIVLRLVPPAGPLDNFYRALHQAAQARVAGELAQARATAADDPAAARVLDLEQRLGQAKQAIEQGKKDVFLAENAVRKAVLFGQPQQELDESLAQARRQLEACGGRVVLLETALAEARRELALAASNEQRALKDALFQAADRHMQECYIELTVALRPLLERALELYALREATAAPAGLGLHQPSWVDRATARTF